MSAIEPASESGSESGTESGTASVAGSATRAAAGLRAVVADGTGDRSGAACTVADCVTALERAFPAEFAEGWDSVGLTVGDPAAPVRRVLFAVDPTIDVAREAVRTGADLLVTHHPLFLRGVRSVASTTPGGRIVTTLVQAGVALFTAHTNADVACGGVNDALAAALGLSRVRGLSTSPETGSGDAFAAGSGSDASAGAAAGEPPATVDGSASDRGPAVNGGLGRLGELAHPEPLVAFCARVAARLPATAGGVRATGDPDRPIRLVAVCGGSGGELVAAAAAAGADAFVTADGRHHHTLDAVAAHDVAVVDVAHWASEWPWLPVAAGRLRSDLAADGRTVVTSVSTIVTDPWRLHAESGR
jgi:dinuclear metal center YbgI/SA1388 family protein